MSRNKIFFTFMAIAIIGVVLLLVSRNTHRPAEKVESQTKVAPPVQVKQVSKLTVDDTKINAPSANKQKPAVAAKQVDLGGLDDEAVDYYSKRAEYMLDNPVHPGRAKLQAQMRKETVRETFHNMTDNDELAMLMPVMGGSPFSPGTYESDVVIVSKMTRVRKLLEDARENPNEVAAFLQEQLRELAKDYPQQYTKFLKELNEAGPDGLHTKQLPEHSRTRLLCTAAVYVLSQIRVDNALPTLAWLSTQGEPGKEISCPVNPKFLFYAMHNIIQKSPRASLSGNSYEYLEKTKAMNIPDAKRIKVTTWNAHFHEDDFRRMLPENKLDISIQPTIELERFPSLDNLSTRKAESLLAELRDLIG